MQNSTALLMNARQSFDQMFSLAHLRGYNIRDEEVYITPLRGMMRKSSGLKVQGRNPTLPQPLGTGGGHHGKPILNKKNQAS